MSNKNDPSTKDRAVAATLSLPTKADARPMSAAPFANSNAKPASGPKTKHTWESTRAMDARLKACRRTLEDEGEPATLQAILTGAVDEWLAKRGY